MDDRQPPDKDALPLAPHVQVNAAWHDEQARKQAAYAAKRAAWMRRLDEQPDTPPPAPLIPCKCKKCGRNIKGGAQLRFAF